MRDNRTVNHDHYTDIPQNISRRHFLISSAAAAAGAFVLSLGLPVEQARAQSGAAKYPAGTYVPAFLEIHPDNTIHLRSPFMEGGQGIFTAMAQIVGEELDADPASFRVTSAPAGDQYKVMDSGMRVTGGSQSVRTSYHTMRRLGALARNMLLQAAAQELTVAFSSLRTEPNRVIHDASGRVLDYGHLAKAAAHLPVPDVSVVTLKEPSQFRWIGKSQPRLDVYDKSVGQAVYSIDCKVDGMVHAAVQHAPRLGLAAGIIRNESQVLAMKGVESVHKLPGAVAVVAERWWNAKRASEALQIEWLEPEPGSDIRYMPADFSSEAFLAEMSETSGDGEVAENVGDFRHALSNSKTTVSAVYQSQYLNHAQLEPPSALARFNSDGSLELWMPNQAPEMFQADIASRTGLPPEQIIIHSPLLGGFFGRHFVYETAMVYPQAIMLARAVGKPVKLIWSREEEFLRDTRRPMAAVRFSAGLNDEGFPVALEAVTVTEGPTEGITGKRGKEIDETAVEGLAKKSYQIPNRRIAQIYKKGPVVLGYWRSVGNSMNDFLYESFLDEIADAGGNDPYELRLQLLKGNERLTSLLKEVATFSGGWKAGPYIAEDGTKRARGIAMASPFGTEAAAIAEVSIEHGQVRVHHVWEAIDPGSIVNPAIIEAQVRGAVTLGLSQVLLEEAVFEKGQPVARNYDMYPILPPSRMPQVHVRIIESGAKMGGIGEPPLPAIPPAVANAVSRLTGERIRRMPLSHYKFS